MKKITKALIIFIVSCWMSGGYAYAQQVSGDGLESLFTINSIAVDETAKNASIARSQAIEIAESIAFDKLKTKLVALDDLPLLSNTDFLNIRSLVLGIEVKDEHAFSNRYMAKINITFKPEAVIDLFTKAGASFILNAGSELCVAHGHKEGLITHLWGLDNRVSAIWQGADLINRIRTYKVAKGTLKERMSLNATTIESGSFEVAENFAKGCETGAGLIVFTQLMTNYQTGASELNYHYWLSDMLITDAGTFNVPLGSTSKQIDALLAQLINQIIESSDEIWRQTAMVKGDEKGEMLLLLHTDQITALAEAEKKLATLSVVRNVSVLRIAIPLTQMKVSYTGSHDQFIQALRQVGYSLEAWGQESLLVPIK